MRNALISIVMLALALAVSACNDNTSPESRQDASSLPEPQTPEVDAEPTPDTGTGGESQMTSPDKTLNSAPQGQSPPPQ
jgi:hypothetical protein